AACNIRRHGRQHPGYKTIEPRTRPCLVRPRDRKYRQLFPHNPELTMKKTLVGLLAALLIAAGGYFGFQAYVQPRVTAEGDATFKESRSEGGRAGHGKLSYDIGTRTLTIADIVSESAAQPPVTARIANLTASGVSSTSDNRFSADQVEVSDVEVGFE